MQPLPPPPEPGPSGLRSLEDHRDYLLSCLEPLPAFSQHVLDALGLSLCEDVYSAVSMPRFDNSAMDGYAVRAVDVAGATADAPVSLPVVGEVAAGQYALHRLSPGTAIKIMTGAPLPDHADAVVPYEATDRGTSDVRVFAPSGVGQHVRYVGEDVVAGAQLFSAGRADRAARRRAAGRHRPGLGAGPPPAAGGRRQHRHRAGRARPGAGQRATRSTTPTPTCWPPPPARPGRTCSGWAWSATTPSRSSS